MSRELDALVAEHVLGYRLEGQPKDYGGDFGGEPVLIPPHETWESLERALPRRGRIAPTFFVRKYSTDLATAADLLGYLEKREPKILSRLTRKLLDDGKRCVWRVEFRECGPPWRRSVADDAALPYAISLAAVRIMGIEASERAA